MRLPAGQSRHLAFARAAEPDLQCRFSAPLQLQAVHDLLSACTVLWSYGSKLAQQLSVLHGCSTACSVKVLQLKKQKAKNTCNALPVQPHFAAIVIRQVRCTLPEQL